MVEIDTKDKIIISNEYRKVTFCPSLYLKPKT